MCICFCSQILDSLVLFARRPNLAVIHGEFRLLCETSRESNLKQNLVGQSAVPG